jgi:threonine dehydratase
MQPTGSFKVRGAFSLLALSTSAGAGVVAASGGNFGLAVAYAAQVLDLRATIFVPETSPSEKLDRISRYGAEVQVIPGYYPDALEASRDWAGESGAIEAHAYDQAEVVGGQGTLGLEISEQASDLTTVLVAVGGGGLIAGIANWLRGEARLVAVEPVACPTLHEARVAGRPVPVEVGGLAASSLGASLLGDHAWQAMQWVDGSVLVSDQSILEAQQWLWETCRVVAEPAGAAPLAALLSAVYRPAPGEHVVAVVSGANASGLSPQT